MVDGEGRHGWGGNDGWGSVGGLGNDWGSVGDWSGEDWGGHGGVVDRARVGGSDWGGVGDWGSIGSDWGGVGSDWGGVGGLGDNWGSIGGNSWDDWSETVDGGGGGWLRGIGAGLVGGDGGSVTESISDVVDSSDSAVSIAETVRAGHHTWTALFLSEGATGGVVFVVGEGVVAVTLQRKEQ